MNKLNKLTGKVKETAIQVKDWTSDHKSELIFCGAMAGVLVGGIVLGRRYDKKYAEMWRKASQAYKDGNLDYDFGPYKLMRIIEPKTGEFIGEVMCHEETCKAFLNIK